MRFELVPPPDRPEETEVGSPPETAYTPTLGGEVRTVMAQRAGSLGSRVTTVARSLHSVLRRLDSNIVRYEHERVDLHAMDESPPPENFRPGLFSGGGDL